MCEEDQNEPAIRFQDLGKLAIGELFPLVGGHQRLLVLVPLVRVHADVRVPPVVPRQVRLDSPDVHDIRCVSCDGTQAVSRFLDSMALYSL